MWFNADYERVTFKTQLSDVEKKLREAKAFIIELHNASSVGVLLFNFSK